MSAATFVSDTMSDAAAPGDCAAPSELLKVATGYANPLAALSDYDKTIELFEAAHRAFPFLGRALEDKALLSAGDHSKLVLLLRWLIEALRGWKHVDDPICSQLVSIFVVAQSCDQDGQLWPLLPSDILNNVELFECVSRLIGSFAVTYGTRGGVQAPIWEQEALDRLKKAEADGDWAAIGDAWRPFEEQLIPNVLQIQTMRCLNCRGVDHLAKAVANVHQTAVAMQLVVALKVDERFSLALASDNPFIEFACVYQALSGRGAARALTPETERLLASVLIKVAGDSPRWVGWMQVFNAYPLRYPLLQNALGLALVDLPDAACEAYIASITLHPTPVGMPDQGRECVAMCLRVFRQHAADAQRAAVWTLAYERWERWRFNQADPNRHLLKISRSPLDYPVVGYAYECLTDAELESGMASFWGELQTIEDRWHASITDAITEWNRLLSMFQPFGYARLVKTTGQDWLATDRECWPFDFSKQEYQYVLSKFGVEPKGSATQP